MQGAIRALGGSKLIVVYRSCVSIGTRHDSSDHPLPCVHPRRTAAGRSDTATLWSCIRATAERNGRTEGRESDVLRTPMMCLTACVGVWVTVCRQRRCWSVETTTLTRNLVGECKYGAAVAWQFHSHCRFCAVTARRGAIASFIVPFILNNAVTTRTGSSRLSLQVF